MLNERKLTERELDHREVVLQNLLKNKRNLVKRYGKDAEKVMYGIATKKAKTKVEGMNKEKIKELIIKSLSNESNNKDINEGHGLDQGDIDILQKFVDGKDMDVIPLKRVLKFIIKSNILQDKTKDLSKGKVDERVTFDDVLDLRADKADLEDRISQLYRDMEQEAEPEGGEVADRYGSELEKLEAKLYRVMKQINDYDMNEGTDNEKEIKGQELVDYIMSNWNWSEEKTLNWLADNYGKGKQDDGPKEKSQDYIDYLRRSGRDEEADKLEKNLEESLNPEVSKKVNMFIKAMAKRYGYEEQDAVYAIMAALRQRDFEGVNEKLTKSSSVEDHIDDFKDSDAKQFKGKSLKKIKQMALASFLSKQKK